MVVYLLSFLLQAPGKQRGEGVMQGQKPNKGKKKILQQVLLFEFPFSFFHRIDSSELSPSLSLSLSFLWKTVSLNILKLGSFGVGVTRKKDG